MRRFGWAALLVAAPAWAQTAPETRDPDEIVVTGRGLDAPPGDAAYDIVTIDRARLANTASGRLEDALRDAAGLAQFRRSDSRSAHPTSQGITLRGLGGNASSRALLLLDGVPQADPFGGWVAFPAYMPERLGAARIVRGGGSGYAGPGALAGTIELTSGSPRDLGPLQLAGFYGSRNSMDAAGVSGIRLGSGFVTFAGQYARGDGFVPVVAEDRGPADRAAPYEQASAAVRTVVDLGGPELQANISAFTDHRDRGVDFTRVKSEGADASLRLVGRGRWGWSALAYLQARGFASGFASVNDARTAATATLDQYSVPATGIGARIELQPPVGRGVTLRLGGDVRRVSGRTQELFTYVAGAPTRRRVAGGASVTAGGFADASYEARGLTLSAGGRIDHWDIADGALFETPLAGGAALTDSRFRDRSGWEATGRLGAAYRLGGVTLRAAAYRGWRLPTLNELYRPFRVGADATAANAALDPERLDGAEIGLDWQPISALTLRATAYWNRLAGAIANVTLASGRISMRCSRRESSSTPVSRSGTSALPAPGPGSIRVSKPRGPPRRSPASALPRPRAIRVRLRLPGRMARQARLSRRAIPGRNSRTTRTPEASRAPSRSMRPQHCPSRAIWRSRLAPRTCSTNASNLGSVAPASSSAPRRAPCGSDYAFGCTSRSNSARYSAIGSPPAITGAGRSASGRSQ